MPHNGCRQPKRREDLMLTWLATPARRSRVSRRLGTNIFENEKGRKALERRPFPPGAHGRTRRRNAGSEYLAQLQEKQKAKYIYGVLERQFRRTYEEAVRLQGPTGENLLRLLEQRLDNVVYRAGWASTRPQARQFVSHGLIQVNGKRVNIASFRVTQGRRRQRSAEGPQHDRDPAQHRHARPLARRLARESATVASRSPCVICPQRDHIDVPVRESLIVELYSK